MSMASMFFRDMGIDKRDFFRILPTAIGSSRHRLDGDRIAIEPIGEAGALTITLGTGDMRRLSASLVLPCMRVEFAFDGASQVEIDRFMDGFDTYYRRGGG